MKSKLGGMGSGSVVVGVLLVSLACGLAPGLPPGAVATPTPTMVIGVAPGGNEPPAESRCKGLSGTLEVQVLAGPAAAVGLEPFGVGEVPFSVAPDSPPYAVQGGGSVSYHDMLQEDWGTYTVDMDLALTVTGECTGTAGTELLALSVQLSGDQMVEVRADGFQGDYPWSGSQTLNLSFPLQEGAMASGEGWSFILHLN
jgi:hypothetical protein